MMLKYRKDGRKLNTDPLRKIVGYKQVDVSLTPGMTMFLEHEEYECGHLALCKYDIYGETNAVRRRCKQCGQESQDDVNTMTAMTTSKTHEYWLSLRPSQRKFVFDIPSYMAGLPWHMLTDGDRELIAERYEALEWETAQAEYYVSGAADREGE